MRGALAAVVLAAVASACEEELPPLDTSSPVGLALAEIRAHEDELRRTTDFTATVGRHRALGPDPASIVLAPGGEHVVGLLRGEDAIVSLNDTLGEIARVEAPRLASALALGGDVLWAAGEGSETLSRFHVEPDGDLRPDGAVSLAPGTRVRGLAFEGDVGFAVDPLADVLVAFDASGERSRVATSASPLRVVATRHWVAVTSLVGHRVEVFARDEAGLPIAPRRGVYVRKGPAWALDAVEDRSGALWVAVTAVEDEALDRTVGAFGHVDSFVEVFRQGDAGLALVASLDVGAQGVVVPKAIALAVDDDDVQVRALAAGSARGIDLTWRRRGDGLEREATFATWDALPGTDSFVGGPGAPVVAASPLLDAFWAKDVADDGPIALARPTPIRSVSPDVSVRLGEALLTTTLLAPGQSSEGPYSRFTCETCHFELGIDGRTHLTGRADDSAATTKPLYGLLNDGPHFTRALDRDLTEVAHNEVRVANQHVDVNPWFAVDRGASPWLDLLVGEDPPPGLLGPLGVRRAIVDVLAALAHRPSTRAAGRVAFDAAEQRGAEIFRERCVSCHAARLVAREAASEVPFDAWSGLIFSEADPIVWARDGYEKTGVEPYVHPDGARTPSLRRVIEKRPYFTNGQAASLADVVARARFGSGVFLHDAGGPARRGEVDPSGLAPFTEGDAEALLAFLALL